MKRLFGFGHLRIRPQSKEFRFGIPEVTAEQLLYIAKPKLFAIFQNMRSQVVTTLTFEDTLEGRNALIAQSRVERLLKVILGHHVQVEAGNRLDFVSGEGAHSDYRRSSVV